MLEQPYVVIFGAAVRPDGSPSGALRDRVGAAARFGRRLLPQPIYIVTGGQGRYGAPEAEVMAQLLMQRGVHEDYIVLEPTGVNTFRSAVAVAGLLLDRPGPVYVGTSGYHMPRCVLLLGLAGLDVHRSPPAIGPASSRMSKRIWWRLREIPAIPIDGVLMLWQRWVRGIRPPEEDHFDEEVIENALENPPPDPRTAGPQTIEGTAAVVTDPARADEGPVMQGLPLRPKMQPPEA